MADNVTGPTILQQNDNRVTISAIVQSDGSGSTTIMGDVSALAANTLGQAVARISIQQLWFSNLVIPGTADAGNTFSVIAEFQKIY